MKRKQKTKLKECDSSGKKVKKAKMRIKKNTDDRQRKEGEKI